MSILTMTPEQYEAHQRRVQDARAIRGAQGGHARAEKLTPERRREIARGAATARWIERKPRQKWDYEQRLAQQLEAAGVTSFFVDAEYIEGRGLRADLLFTEQRLVVEIQGAVHRIRETWAKDIEKAQVTMLAGYRLLPIATKQVRDGSAVNVIKRVLGVTCACRA